MAELVTKLEARGMDKAMDSQLSVTCLVSLLSYLGVPPASRQQNNDHS